MKAQAGESETGSNNAAKTGSFDTVKFAISDTGIGIEPAELDRIFKPFEQVENSASRMYQGTGLGLSLTKSHVDPHSGKIWAESEGPGKGSIFQLILPVNASS
jgi:signal transduction histidine kinase